MLAADRTDPAASLANGTRFIEYVKNTKFIGSSGLVIMDDNADSTNHLPISRCLPLGQLVAVITKDYDNATGTVTVMIDDRQFWFMGTVPKDEPDCGYTGAKCNNNPYYIAAGAVALFALVLLTVFWSWRQR